MNKFLVILLNTPSPEAENIRLNNLIQELNHPALLHVFVCEPENMVQCPYPANKVTTVPAVKFMLKKSNETYQEVAELTSNINQGSVISMLDSLQDKTFDLLPGEDGEGIIPGGKPGGDLLGLGIFNLGFNMPGWLWLILAGVATYKATTAKTTLGIYGFGAAGLVAGINYLNKQRSINGISKKGEIEFSTFPGYKVWLTTDLDLKGRGITLVSDGSNHKRGLKNYIVTDNAFNKLKSEGYKMVFDYNNLD